MVTLSERDADALLRFVAELHDLDDPLPFPPRLLGRLRELIPCDEAGYSVLDPMARASVLQIWHCDDGEHEVVGGDGGFSGDEETSIWWHLRHTHPLCGYRTSTGDWTTPYKVSDLATLREFRRTPIYDTFYRGTVDHWLDVGLPATATRTRVFIFTRRDGPDFTERDKLVLKLLQPHLLARAHAARTNRQPAPLFDEGVEELTSRERQVLDLVTLGRQNDEIALNLGIAPGTVAKHLEHAYRKLRVTNRTAAAAALHH
jgi:DNA-binding CsgD family transcriptional regulator